MKNRSSTQFKAAILTIVFLLNTFVGFACATGMNTGFNRDVHQEHEIYSAQHSHQGSEHHHAKHGPGQDNTTTEGEKDNCCKDQVSKITKADKLNQAGFNYKTLSSLVFPLPAAPYTNNPGCSIPENVSNTYFLRHIRPPIPDLRIAIQSLQI